MGFWDSVTGIIERQLVNRAFNLSGQHKDIFCERCRRITDHVSISHARSLQRRHRRSSRRMRVLSHLVGRLNDLNPAENILVGRPYRCGGCGGIILD
jgi:hypothetical protein